MTDHPVTLQKMLFLQTRWFVRCGLDKLQAMGGSAIITADHGNSEKMSDGSPDVPYTAHTVGDVPLVLFDNAYKGKALREDGTLADIAPTMLQMMGLAQPDDMTGKTLIA